MPAVADDALVVLDDLDFEVPCCKGQHPATFTYSCRSCRATYFICASHLAQARAWFARCRCAACHEEGANFDAVMEVVPL